MIKPGDKVNVTDGSYGFGIMGGEFTDEPLHGMKNQREGLNCTIVETGLSILMHDKLSEDVVDTLVTNEAGDYFFYQSEYCELADRVIFIDGKRIPISAKSFNELKKQLCD